MPGWVPTVESEILTLSLSTPPFSRYFTDKSHVSPIIQNIHPSPGPVIPSACFSPGEARYVSGQAWDQSRIDAANTAAQNWVSDYRGMKSLMFFKAFNSLLKWKE